VLLTRGEDADADSGVQKVLSLLRFSHVRAGPVSPSGHHRGGVTNDARYLVAWTAESEVGPRSVAEVDIVHPRMQSTPFRVRLNAGDTLVLPPMWRMEVTDSTKTMTTTTVNSMRLYDTFSLVRAWFEK
jgi:hypothetical protein